MNSQLLKKSDLFSVVWRSFFIQAAFNFQTLISMGVTISLFPIAKKLCKTPVDWQAFLERHLLFFNAHPYFAAYALGVSIHLEEAAMAGDSDALKKMGRIKTILTSTLGALGDKLFWASLKPLSLIIGTGAVFILPNLSLKLLGLFGAFLLYNIPHVYVRYIGVMEGYKYGLSVHKCLDENRFATLRLIYLIIGTLTFIMITIQLFYIYSVDNILNSLFFLVAIFFSSTVYYSSKNFYFTIAITFIISILAGFILYK